MNNPTIQDLYILQLESDSNWINIARFRSDEEYRNGIIRGRLLDMHEELSELAATFNLSNHKLNREYDKDNTTIQIVDGLKYLIGLAQLLEITPDELYEAYQAKTSYLNSKWAADAIEFEKHMKVIVFDLDGVLADHEKGFIDFVQKQEGIGLKSDSNSRSSYSYHDRLGITKEQEERLKTDFTKSGGFARLPLFPSVKEVIKVAKEKAKVVFITAREAHKFKRLYSDTAEWLKLHDIQPDALFWNKDKADALIDGVYPAKILCFVEDRDKHALEIAHLGIKTWLLDKPYNKGIEHKNITRVYGGLFTIECLIKEV